ncbi:MAG: DAK2 domain-containing protein [Dehalococcoidia bacterium]|nr:DAK2 domain-containing protein [Dehalococcoidia bacterium]
MQEPRGAKGTGTLEYSGQDLRDMFAAATSWLEKSVPDINALNVFPVPDGDCGTNMLLTMRSTLEEAYRAPDNDAGAVAQAMARGALMGARGNSGVILSQIFRGLAQGLEGHDTFRGKDFAAALTKGSTVAYKALTRPVEGTILTVARDASAAAREASASQDDLVPIMEATVVAARESVARTPTLLPTLKQAGVVDAGGQGLYVLFEGALLHLKGDTDVMEVRRPQVVASVVPLVTKFPQLMTEKEEPFGYCTEFVLEGNKKLNPENIRKGLANEGQCLIVVGDENLVHIHIHTFDPGKVLHRATSLGVLHEIKIQNMDDQHKEYTEMVKAQAPPPEIATVAVVSGDGLGQVFRSLGVSAIVPGGQTMNPSTREILQAVESLPQDKVIILPNNKNVIPAARQVKGLTSKKVRVVPTETVPQGVAALLAFNYDTDLKTNASMMEDAMAGVKTIEITRAVRPAKIGNMKILRRQAIGFADGELKAVGDKPIKVLLDVLDVVKTDTSEIVTVYYGKTTKRAEAEEAVEAIRRKHPNLEVELVYGGQPHYNYIASVE